MLIQPHKVLCNCKFCGREITVTVDLEGEKVNPGWGDWMIKLAACNRCAAHRQNTWKLIDRCENLVFRMWSKKISEEDCKEQIDETVKEFRRNLCDYFHTNIPYVEELSRLIIRPKRGTSVSAHIKAVFDAYREKARDQAKNATI